MPADNPLSDVSVTKLVAGIAGAAVSMKFLQGTWTEKALMAAGGSVLSYFATTPIAEWLSTPRAEGLVGFLVGLFGMAIASKFYEVIQMLDSREMAKEAWAWVVRKWKA